MEKNTICHITHKKINSNEGLRGDFIRKPLFDMICSDFPDFTRKSLISHNALNQYRKKYLRKVIEEEVGEYDRLEKEVVESITHNKILSENVEYNIKEKLTFGQKVADNIAEFGGSWAFIGSFFSFIIFWIFLNIWILGTHTFDPFPFILLNLILSCLASLQAPVIMMSQNRKEQKDRIRSEYDYKVDLKAELEVRILEEKIDLAIHQNRRILEIQELQNDYLEEK